MKHILNLFLSFVITGTGCSQEPAKRPEGVYYSIEPDNFIDRIEIKKDTITKTRLRPYDFQPNDGITHIAKICEAIRRGDTCYLYLSEWDKVREKLFFKVISITETGNNRFLMVPGSKRYTSLEESKRQQYPDPVRNFYFTLYKQKTWTLLKNSAN